MLPIRYYFLTNVTIPGQESEDALKGLPLGGYEQFGGQPECQSCPGSGSPSHLHVGVNSPLPPFSQLAQVSARSCHIISTVLVSQPLHSVCISVLMNRIHSTCSLSRSCLLPSGSATSLVVCSLWFAFCEAAFFLSSHSSFDYLPPLPRHRSEPPHVSSAAVRG